MDLNVKTFLVLAVIGCCFAVLFPKIFQPMILNMFGRGKQSKEGNDFDVDGISPHMRGMHPHGQRAAQGRANAHPHEEMLRHMGGSPHPGMRAAAEMRKEAAAGRYGGGGNSSVMTVVLPMYAVGIVLYLIYTMTKVFGSKKKSEEDYLRRHFSDVRGSERRDEQRLDNYDDGDEFSAYRRKIQGQQELERLLVRADSDDIGEMELNDLKRRLQETEEQMTRILQAMSNVETKVQTVVASGDIAANDTLTDTLPQEEGGTGEEDKAPHEDIGKQDDETGEVHEDIGVETVGAREDSSPEDAEEEEDEEEETSPEQEMETSEHPELRRRLIAEQVS